MCVGNKQFELLDLVYVILKYNEISLTFLLGMCACVVVVVMWWSLVCLSGCFDTIGGECGDCDACAVVCVGCEYAASMTVMLGRDGVMCSCVECGT